MEAKELVEKYVKLRDKVAELQKATDEKTKPLKELMSRIETALAEKLATDGVESMRTESGTAFFKTATSCTVADWDAALSWVKEHEAWHFIEQRMNKTAVEEFIKESQGDLPPGISYKTARVVQVRRN